MFYKILGGTWYYPNLKGGFYILPTKKKKNLLPTVVGLSEIVG